MITPPSTFMTALAAIACRADSLPERHAKLSSRADRHWEILKQHASNEDTGHSVTCCPPVHHVHCSFLITSLLSLLGEEAPPEGQTVLATCFRCLWQAHTPFAVSFVYLTCYKSHVCRAAWRFLLLLRAARTAIK